MREDKWCGEFIKCLAVCEKISDEQYDLNVVDLVSVFLYARR